MPLPGVPPVPGAPGAPAPTAPSEAVATPVAQAAPQAAPQVAPQPAPPSQANQAAAPVSPAPAPSPAQAAPAPAAEEEPPFTPDPPVQQAPAVQHPPAQQAPPAQAPPAQAAPPAAPQVAAAPMPPAGPDVGQQIATAQPQGGAVPQYQGVPEAGNLNAAAEQDGFGGLSFDSYGVFPVITLNDGEFRSSDGNELGSEFHVKLMRSRPKYLYKTDLPYNDPRGEVSYSYDMVTSASGKPLEEIFEAWRAKGIQPLAQPAIYVEATAQRVDNGQIVLLSIPKNSIPNLSAYWAQLKFNGEDVREVTTRVHKGRRVERAVQPFVPWAFSKA